MRNWHVVDGSQEIPTPALLIYPERIKENIIRMIRIAGSPDKLRPHVKTHKMSEIIRLQVAAGITRFKCSTIVEAEVTASAGGEDILLAMQPVGKQIDRFFMLMNKFPGKNFSTIVDDFEIVREIESKAKSENRIIDLWVDINNGMNRTGITPGKDAFRLYSELSGNPSFNVRGLHVYDGHIHERELIDRHVKCEGDFEPVRTLISDIIKAGMKNPVIVAGGTPTFPIHAKRENTETSPGTCLLWDSGYEEHFPDLSFLQAAVVLTRIVSKPGENLICFDLGHKAIAAEMPHPRVKIIGINIEKFLNHSEEHLAVQSRDASKFRCGDLFYGIPWHICPTVPRYPFAYTVRNNRIDGKWNIEARDR
ncbi:MAG TPA: D-TA family PLP-dependent enzyme [Bacteroidales bacterium]|jgi:D-serine deaminase-like pyridoxal phosphate-dependent protein|nr:D-TA family PLP-dependent enzyme [Bacteroidales bacterium]